MISSKEKAFWKSVIEPTLTYKNPNCSDEKRIYYFKKKVREEKQREAATHKKNAKALGYSPDPKEKMDYEILGFSLRRLAIYLQTLTIENNVSTPTVVCVFWNGNLPPKAGEEQRVFDLHTKMVTDFIEKMKSFPRTDND